MEKIYKYLIISLRAIVNFFRAIINFIKLCYNYFLRNKLLRNLFSTLLDLTAIGLMGYDVYYSIIGSFKGFNWFLVIGFPIIAFILFKIAFRYRVVNVCPNCGENRSLCQILQRTGNTTEARQFVNGDYWFTEYEEEWKQTIKCLCCDLCEVSYSWETVSLQGDITQEARLRQEKANRENYLQQLRDEHDRQIRDYQEMLKYRKRSF